MATNGKQTTNGNGPNWRAIEHAYVTDPTEPTYAQLAQRFHAKAEAIESRGRRGKWFEKRQTFRRKVAATAQKSAGERQAESLADQNLAFAAKWRELAEHHIANALKAEKGWEAQSWTVAAATAFDKWRLGTGQTTDRKQVDTPGLDEKAAALLAPLMRQVPTEDSSGDN